MSTTSAKCLSCKIELKPLGAKLGDSDIAYFKASHSGHELVFVQDAAQQQTTFGRLRVSMRYFLDTEFYDNGSTIDLISIGIVCEDGREFHAGSADCHLDLVDDWIKQNVVPKLPPKSNTSFWLSRDEIRSRLPKYFFCPLDRNIDVWGYYADYDWVCLSQLFGGMLNLRKHIDKFPMYCLDLKQLSVSLGSPPNIPHPVQEHDALVDAHWNRDLYNHLTNLQNHA